MSEGGNSPEEIRRESPTERLNRRSKEWSTRIRNFGLEAFGAGLMGPIILDQMSRGDTFEAVTAGAVLGVLSVMAVRDGRALTNNATQVENNT